MAVLGEHRKTASEAERAFMIEALNLIARQKYGDNEFIIDDVMRQIPDHCHIHVRPKRWRG
jgi:diadenosine tetraphosphate (Ap4A) HIT family hydrolase